VGPLTDEGIERRLALPAADPRHLRISPFDPHQIKARDERWVPCVPGTPASRRVVGSGLSGMGYDIRLGTAFRKMVPTRGAVIDPLDPDVGFVFDPTPGHPPRECPGPFVLEAGGCLLGESAERFRIPEDVLALVIVKSTLARCFLDLNTTPLEPGWEGTITIEIKNNAILPQLIRPGEGIGQVVFLAAHDCARTSYNRQPLSAYQHQTGPTTPRGAQAAAPDAPAAPRPKWKDWHGSAGPWPARPPF